MLGCIGHWIALAQAARHCTDIIMAVANGGNENVRYY